MRFLKDTQATAVILEEKYAAENPAASLIVDNPEVAFAKISKLFAYRPQVKSGIDRSAVVGDDCDIDSTAMIGARCVLGVGVKIGANSQISPGTVLGDYVEIGSDCMLYSNVTCYHHVTVGDRVMIHSGAVIGADGFGFARDKDCWQKVEQLGNVRIGNDVEIGANTCIDRGALQDTIIGDGVKLDNLVQIGHNVEVGDHTVMAGMVAIAGSAKIGKHCMLGGAVKVRGHIDIADGVMIGATSTVGWPLRKAGSYASGFAAVDKDEWMRNARRFYQLEDYLKRLRKLESVIDESNG